LKLGLTEVSAKIRSGPVQDDEEDYALPVWAGDCTAALQAETPVRDERCDPAHSDASVCGRTISGKWRDSYAAHPAGNHSC